MRNEYLPFYSKIKEIVKHTEIEYTFRMTFKGEVKPGQFFEVSLPRYGEAPISVSGIGNGTVDLTIRKVGQVTNEIFQHHIGDGLFLRGPYGNGFDISNYIGKELIVVAGGTGLSPVKGVLDYFYKNPQQARSVTLIAGFKSPKDVLFKEDINQWYQKMQVILTVDYVDEDKDVEFQTGLVTKYIPEVGIKDKENVAVIIVGPPVMMKYSTQEFLQRGIGEEQLWISQERKMCCGIGKCGHCKIGDTYICLDGPVFNYTKGKMLLD